MPTDAEMGSRVGQRLTNLLEDRMRSRSNMERERQQRFIAVARQLVAEGEPEVLAMLLDEAYQASLHDAPVGPAMDRSESEYDVRQREAREEREGRGGRRRDRREEPRADDDRPDEAHADARDDVSSDRNGHDDDRQLEAEAKPKKKRRRSKRRKSTSEETVAETSDD